MTETHSGETELFDDVAEDYPAEDYPVAGTAYEPELDSGQDGSDSGDESDLGAVVDDSYAEVRSDDSPGRH